VMRHDLWDGPGRLKARLATDAYDGVREDIEGSRYDYDESVVHYHADYPQEKEARKIVEGDGKYPGVGMPNARAAFFLGHTDLLGLGEGTRAAGSLAGIANYKASDVENAEIVEAQAGDTFESIRDRTGAPVGGILDAAAGKPVKAGDAIAAGTKLKVPGIRYVYAIEEDTLGSIAAQNRVDPSRIAIANGLAADTSRDHKFAAGARVLIPIHQGGP
jgi:LysM domain-containing protein